MITNIRDGDPFSCGSDEGRSACSGLSAHDTHNGKAYCILHFPGPKGPEFWTVIREKVKNADLDFSGVWFPPDQGEFTGLTFSSEAKFAWAHFDGDADFDHATFNLGADFSYATFTSLAKFTSVTFSGPADFYGTLFLGEGLFTFSTFQDDADFQKAYFDSLLSLDFANAKSYLLFGTKGNKGQTGTRPQGFSLTSALSMESARIDHPECVFFHTLRLRPHWFINIDVREFSFTQVFWVGFSGKRYRFAVEEEVDLVKAVDFPRRLLSITYRQLAVNAEENHRYRHASIFRFCSMDVRRRQHSVIRSLGTLDGWYWLASGYGEKAAQAFSVLVILWLLFGVAYIFVDFTKPALKPAAGDNSAQSNETMAQRLHPRGRAFLYSAEVITVQKPDPKPATAVGRTLVILETVLGPTQIALFALALRRKFMR